ncbi:MAG: PAS domain S-box protein [Candidatus Manganitrophus sp.]|nr:MAG: PAS domain S-box protein [Candidatus Manganitrophus sp.]
MKPPLPQDEPKRLETLRQYQILDTPSENVFDDLTRLASDVCEAPIAAITFIDDHRQWFKSKIGVSPTETPRESAICAHAILQRQPLIVHDTASDPRFSDNPWVTSDPHVRFYAGAPLLTPEGHALGTVCVMDYAPRELRPKQIEGLQTIAHETMLLLDLRRQLSASSRMVTGLREAEEALRESEEKYRILFEHNPHPMWVFDPETLAFLAVNESAIRHYGYSREEFLSMTIKEIRPPEDIPRLLENFRKMSPGISRAGVWRHRKKDGTIIDVEITRDLISFMGKQAGLTLANDVTERKKAEEEHARLLHREREARAAAVQAQWRFTFLAEASEILSASLDYETTLESVARLAIPFLADGCVVDIVEEDQSIRRVAAVATDPAKEALGLELMRRYPPERGGAHPLRQVLTSGKTMILSDIPDALLETIARDSEHLKLAKALGIKSAMIVPLSARGKTLGALSFVTMESGRRFGEDDLSLAEDLARRVAVAIDNARLYRGAQREIEERKEAEAALRESQRTLTTLMSNLPGLVYRCRNDENYTIEFISEGVVPLLGYPPADFTQGKITPAQLIHPDDRAWVWEGVQGALKEKRSFQFVYRIYTRSGEEKWVWEKGQGIFSPTGELLFLEGFITDVTERKRAEENLASEKERLAVTLRSIGDGVITTDMEERIVLMNKVAEGLTGWTQQDAIGRRLSEVFQMVEEKTGRSLENPAAQVLQTGVTVGLINHTILLSRDGTEQIIAHSGAPIRDKAGHILGVVLVFRDITQQQRMEEELLRTSKLEAVGLLAGGIAHDFNNILTAILGNLSLVKMSIGPTDPLHRRVSDAETASLRARDLAQQLLTFAKGGTPIKKTVSMKELLKDSIEFVLHGSNVGVEFVISDDLWPVEIDEGQISQVLHNLVINAQQAMPQGGIIKVRAENDLVKEGDKRIFLKPGRYVQISIRDFGIGIPKDHLSKIFDPYFTTKQKGSGLGLPTSYSIIKKHDGYMTADSDLGKGSIFFIYLAASSHDVEPERRSEAPLRGKGKILIMDDEQAVREVAGELLGFLGYRVGHAEDGAEAIARYREASASGEPFDLVIMDLTVPGKMGGKEAIQRLLEIDPHVRAIVSSGYSNDPIMGDYARYGFKGVIAKPYQLEQLSKTVHDVITGTPG